MPDLISKNNLEQIIRNVCQSVIREELQKYLITEMAYSLSEYKDKSDNLIPQIVENWCLVRYVTLSGDKIEYQNHWRKELIAHLRNIAQMKLKNGNNSTTKQNALYSLWNRRDLDNDENCIHLHIVQKFEEENILTYGNVYNQVIKDFKDNTKDIVNVLVSNSYSDIVNYVNSI